jgi:predicted ATPase/transcriptional regulator with XRE-family HTH domain
MEAPLSFGGYVRRRRKALDLTQEELAGCVGCSTATIQKIERDERRPSRQIAELLAGCLEISQQDRSNFIKAARAERNVDHLSNSSLDQVPVIRSHTPAVTASHPITNLPASFTTLVGREPELSELAQLLLQPGCRLLSLLGAGGIGKTRLALEIASRLYSQGSPLFVDGIYYIQLAPIESVERIIPAIASALAFTFSGPGDPAAQLFNALRRKKMLLVMDNMEHLMEADGLVTEILQRSPGVKILVTSRERLNLHGECLFEIHGLPVPPPGRYENMETYSSVALFTQAARRSWPKFILDENNREPVGRICRSLDGMPLGIEMAAAWVRVLSPQEIADEIERNLDFLFAPGKNFPERHRSLRAVFDHSWNLLSSPEQDALKKISVFSGDFSRNAAEQVTGAGLALLSALVDKSLVERVGEGRYQLHELIRQYAAAHLQINQPAQAETLSQHSRYYLGRLYAAGPLIKSARQNDAITGLTPDLENIRLAWDWAVQQGYLEELRQAGHPLMLYHELRNTFHEAQDLFKQAVELGQGMLADPAAQALNAELFLGDMLSSLGWFTFRLGRVDEALDLIRQANLLLRKQQQPASLALNLWHYATVCWFAGQFDEATQFVLEGLEIERDLGDAWGVANLTVNLGALAHERGDYEQAYRLLVEGLALARVCGDPRLISFAIIYLDRNPQIRGSYEEMKPLLVEVLDLAVQTGNRYGKGVVLERLALAEQVAGDIACARQLMQESIQLFTEIEDRWSLSRGLALMGNISRSTGNWQEAEGIFSEAFCTALGAHLYPNALDALAGLAAVNAAQGQELAAYEMAQVVLEHPAATQAARQQAELVLAEIEPETKLADRMVVDPCPVKNLQQILQDIEYRTVGSPFTSQHG